MDDNGAAVNDVLVMATDEQFLEPTKAVMVGARRVGQWRGDVCLIVPQAMEVADLERRGIHIVKTDLKSWYMKFELFGQAMRQWERAIFTDVDVLVQRPLAELLPLLDEGDVWMDHEGGTSWDSFRVWDKRLAERMERYEQIRRDYPALDQQTFNTSVVVYRPDRVPAGTRDRLVGLYLGLYDAAQPDSPWTDQPIINLLLNDQTRQVPRRLFCYHPFATEETVIRHYCRWYAPWFEKAPGADGYLSEQLGRPVYDIYRENRDAFEGEYPCLT